MKQAQSSKVSQFALIAAFGGFVFGLDAANISGAVKFVSSLFELDSIQQGTLVGIALIGVIVALFFTGTLCEKFGRARVLLAIGLTYAVSSIVSSLALNYEMLLVGRFIGGVAFASITVSAMYIGEIAEPESRGKFVSVNQFMIGLGLLVAFVINYFLIQQMDNINFITSENIWRYMLGAELIANAVWVVLLLRIPESPRWLIKQNRIDDAKLAFNSIGLKQSFESFLQDVQKSIKKDKPLSSKQQLNELFSKKMRFILGIAICYAIVQGATGMNAVLFFAPMVFEQVGMSVEDTFFQTIITGVVGLTATIIAITLVEKLGRRALTLGGLLLVVVAHGSTYKGFSEAKYIFDETAVAEIAITMKSNNIDVSKLEPFESRIFNNDVELKKALAEVFDKRELPLISGKVINETIDGVNSTLVLFGIFAFLAAFNMSIGPIMWVIFSEIFPNSVRSIALPFAALVQTISSWSIQQFFPWQLDNMGVGSIFLIYALLGLTGLLIMFFILPETKGKSIEQIESDLVKA